MDCLFVYGTLRPSFDHPMSEFLQNHSILVGSGSYQGKLFHVEDYPGVIPSYSKDDLVIGEVFKLKQPELILPKLDEYEAYYPELDKDSSIFVRTLATIHMNNNTSLDAWVYLYNRPTTSLKIIENGDYLNH
ncbi:MAG: gamma-glutamylcyclotransferase family protein [Verrucomicrobiota bacterium]